MGIAQAGLAFRATTPMENLASVMASVFGEEVAEIASPVAARFDIRNHSDVMVQLFGDVCFVSNDDLAWPLLKNDSASADRLHAVLGAPELMLAFCHYDAGGSHGYALFERGKRRRTRLQTEGLPDLPPLAESGAPLPFEQRWLKAAHYVEAEARPHDSQSLVYYLGNREVLVPARDLTGRMLHDGLESLFGICPWDTLITPTYRFFRVGPEGGHANGRDAEEPASLPLASTPRRAWWRLR
jgi:hypothetical protein